MVAITTTNKHWVISIQPRRLPKNLGIKRSMTGAHRNLNVYGNPVKENKATVWISILVVASHACKVLDESAMGIPEEKLSNSTTAMFRLPSACIIS